MVPKVIFPIVQWTRMIQHMECVIQCQMQQLNVMVCRYWVWILFQSYLACYRMLCSQKRSSVLLYSHDKTEIMLKVALDTIIQPQVVLFNTSHYKYSDFMQTPYRIELRPKSKFTINKFRFLLNLVHRAVLKITFILFYFGRFDFVISYI